MPDQFAEPSPLGLGFLSVEPATPTTVTLERIFDRYYAERHAEAPNEPAEGHFGIGLSIAHRYVEAMGGSIEAENRTPHGLALHVRLPLAPAGE